LTNLTVTTPPTHIVQNLIIAELPSTRPRKMGKYSSSMTSLAHFFIADYKHTHAIAWVLDRLGRVLEEFRQVRGDRVKNPVGHLSTPTQNMRRVAHLRKTSITTHIICQLDFYALWRYPKVISLLCSSSRAVLYFFVNISFYNFEWPKNVKSLS
jgi:hypothetical protein